jgi:peroxiredoxin
MKKHFFLLLAICALSFGFVQAQEEVKTFPSINLKDLEGGTFNTADLANDGKPIVVSFWATWCKPCIQELVAISDYYEDWQTETGVKLVAISVDDARTSPKVPGFVSGKGWDYEVYIDENSDLKRALGIVNVPHTFLLDGKGNIVWQHNSYVPGDEEHLHEEIVKLTKEGTE